MVNNQVEETQRELEIMFTSGLGRTLSILEQEILLDVVAYPAKNEWLF